MKYLLMNEVSVNEEKYLLMKEISVNEWSIC